ncbi:hypothetical protein IWW46_003714, partial [Coemansia sp. RSA 2440]
PTPEENAEAIVMLGLPPTHPAAADSIPRSSVSGSVAPESPATTDANEPVKSESDQPKSESSPFIAEPVPFKSEPVPFKSEPEPVKSEPPLALPPMPSSVNSANGVNNA